jgi:hypothetical protein
MCIRWLVQTACLALDQVLEWASRTDMMYTSGMPHLCLLASGKDKIQSIQVDLVDFCALVQSPANEEILDFVLCNDRPRHSHRGHNRPGFKQIGVVTDLS